MSGSYGLDNLPSKIQAQGYIEAGVSDAIDRFVYEAQPGLPGEAKLWRGRLVEALHVAAQRKS